MELGEHAPAAALRPPADGRAGEDWRVLHYGRVPRYDAATWDLRVIGSTASGRETRWDRAAFERLPVAEVEADLHCVTGFTIPSRRWSGVPAATVLELAPPAAGVEHVMLWAEYGYSANVRLADLQAPGVLLATHEGGAPLTPEHGWPLRLVLPHLYGWKGPKWLRAVEYLEAPRRGFWEERGYHLRGEVARQQRYSHDDG